MSASSRIAPLLILIKVLGLIEAYPNLLGTKGYVVVVYLA